MQKNILIIFTGGTIACLETSHGLQPLLDGERLLRYIPELPENVMLKLCQLCNIDSTDVEIKHWLAMAEVIEQSYDDYDGFIVCHGTDTMAYTAAVLSYLVQNSRKPVVITGSQQPVSREKSDAVWNLRDSILYVSDERAQGVSVVFGGAVIEGTRAKKVRSRSYRAFESINFPVLAEIQKGKIMWNSALQRMDGRDMERPEVRFFHKLNKDVYILKLMPGMQAVLLSAIFEKYDCIIVEGFGLGGMPSSLFEEFCNLAERYEKAGKARLIIIATQVISEGTDLTVYEVGQRLKERISVLETFDMNNEAVFAKAMWILGQENRDFEQIKKLFYTPVGMDIFCNNKIKKEKE